ncbi:unnamed protein product [Tenebrio molitor]|nr:unnamed protein product [Tenebrio molitor]
MPKENKQQSRTQSRRAASKEALKQMHLLLGDERKLEISSGDDDDVIEVEVQPPKKKYKLSHRKSSDGNDRDVIVLKTVEESPFDLEVVVEDLSPCQKSHRDLLKKEHQEVDTKIGQLLSTPNTEVVYNGVFTTAVEITEQIQSILGAATATSSQFTIANQANALATTAAMPQAVPGQSIVLQQQPAPGNNALPQSYQLVMDPRLGVIVGAVSTPTASSNTPPLQLYQPKVTIASTAPVSNTPEQPMKTRRGTILRQVPSSAIPPLHKATLIQQKSSVAAAKGTVQNKPLQVKPLLTKAVNKPVGTIPKTITAPQKPIMPMKGRPTSSAAHGTFRPTESSVEGGLSMGGKPSKSIDLTGDDGRALPDSREVSFNKLQGRTYPSLVVVARPHLRVKDLAADRGKLDVKVKSVLMYPPTKFTEWLIQQGLVRSEQKCSIHAANALKLGMYSDASKFPYSGGYVWISECCPQRFVSVFSGSLFEGSQHPPMAILKLLYHWCCQTIVQNVTQWVKVDNLYVKGMYTWLRSVCTVALHTHIKQLGGPGVKVQVGVISLGTTSQDGNKREVKVEVLGILETTTRHIRLRAVEPLADGERNYKKRFTKILEPVFNWVHPSSIIVTDLTVDKATLHQMGFLHVTQTTSTDYGQSNRTIMEYLRRIVPRMFQNTLSLLSRQIIQQFLDELVWREWYGTTVLQCFDNMVQHLSEQTRFDSGQSLIVRLNKVILNPFKNWGISVPGGAPAKITDQPMPKRYSRQRKPTTPQPLVPVIQDVMRPSKSTSPDLPEQMVPLENYYYGTINPPYGNSKNKITINIKCPFCKYTFNTNITLMNHLFKHAHNVSNDVQLCKYCLTIVPSGNDLLKHIGSAHPDETKFDNGFVCLICEAHFRNPFILGKHMSKEHCPSELPYMCGTCTFRCSNHKMAVDHFYQHHDQGTTIQCPFCLKSTTIYSGGRNISQNMNYFIQHLQKHQKKHLAKRCGRCTLWFIQKEFLKDHQTKMHISQRGKHGLVPCFAPRNGVMVPKSRMDKCPDDAKVINFSALHFNVGKILNCKECDKPLSTPKHFASFECCQNPNCQYATCCSASMQEHVVKCKFLNSKLPAEKLPYELFCICGYSDIYGNLMAKHLAICERKSAYPSREAAKDATVTHSMLDVLGLVRKPDEATSSKEPAKRPEGQPLQPIILKQRGRPRKVVVDANKIATPAKEVKVSKENDVGEVKLNISDVRGGVDCNEVKEGKSDDDKQVPQEVDLTENDSSQESCHIVEEKERKDDDDAEQTKQDNEVKEDEGKAESEVVSEEKDDVSGEHKEDSVTDEQNEDVNGKHKEDSVTDEQNEDVSGKHKEDSVTDEQNEDVNGKHKEDSVTDEQNEDQQPQVDGVCQEEEKSGEQVEIGDGEERGEQSSDAQNNETVSERKAEEDTTEQLPESVENESMEVDSCDKQDTTIDEIRENVAIEENTKGEVENVNNKDTCPMDTD